MQPFFVTAAGSNILITNCLHYQNHSRTLQSHTRSWRQRPSVHSAKFIQTFITKPFSLGPYSIPRELCQSNFDGRSWLCCFSFYFRNLLLLVKQIVVARTCDLLFRFVYSFNYHVSFVFSSCCDTVVTSKTGPYGPPK